MKMHSFERRLDLPVDSSELFAWHTRPGAFERLSPPWEDVELIGAPAPIEAGATQEMRVRVGPVTRKWVSKIAAVEPGHLFRDVALAGPFPHWDHTHLFESRGPGRSTLVDRIEYALPLGALGAALAGSAVRHRLERTFAYRHRLTASDLARHVAAAGARPLTIVVTGASGMVGRALVSFLTTGGHEVRRLVRGEPGGEGEFRWNPRRDEIDPRAFEGADAVVHLAGESIAEGRWTRAKKDRILRSRVEGTRTVARAVREARNGPAVMVSASAVGWYGDRGDELLDEESAPGNDFLARVCAGWEKEATGAGGARVVQLRFGVILSAAGGALRKMLPPFRMGAGGRIGSGKQWMSWIALDDVIHAIHRALTDPSLSGPVNTVAPEPVTNATYTRTLASVLGRPAVLPMPALAARAAFGELADALLLASQRVRPARLLANGFTFDYPDLAAALRHQLGLELDVPRPSEEPATAAAPGA